MVILQDEADGKGYQPSGIRQNELARKAGEPTLLYTMVTPQLIG
jgi:hypothetical protein